MQQNLPHEHVMVLLLPNGHAWEPIVYNIGMLF
jgi:hypothetical protein